MSNRVMIGFVAGMGMLALTAVGQAQNTPSGAGKTDAPMGSKSDMNTKSSATKKATGEVTSVDPKTGKLMVKTTTEELNLDAQSSAAKKSLSNIKVGDKVNVSYQDKGGTLMATSVRKASAASSKAGSGSSSSMGSGSSSSSSSSKDNMGSSSTGSGSSSTGSSTGTGSSTKSR